MNLARTFHVTNSQGLHARPCHAVVSAALAHRCDVRVSCGPRQVNGKSILDLMSLQASCGSQLEFRVQGEDATELLDELERLFTSGFGELEAG